MLRFNDNNEVINQEEYKGILVGLELNEDISYSMEELEGLAEADNVQVIGQMVQHLEKPNKATFIGKGKTEELKLMCDNMQADIVIFNDELSGMQLRNLEEALDVRIIDRTTLILDIFAKRAFSKEGKLQVEYAQLAYRLPRLTGMGKSLSRQAGGIGTRGPGEKKLETDRRHIQKRMDDIKAELKKIETVRNTQRSKREKNSIPVVALVGYTNAGKSAIMNRLLGDISKEEKSVFEKDMLFATLDTSHRKISLDSKQEFILIDTVGFVSKLPHSLVKAFKSTLEEVTFADLLIHVVDSSYEYSQFQIDVTEKVLKELGVKDKKRIIAYNKFDITKEEVLSECGCDWIYISAKTGENIEQLIEMIRKEIFEDRIRVKLLIPFNEGEAISYLHNKGNVYALDYVEEGTVLDVEISRSDYNRYSKYDTL